MKWKLLVAATLVLIILGLLFFTEEGRKYAISLGSLTRSFTNTLGNFISSMVKVSEKGFNLELNLNKQAVYGQNFSFADTFEAFGRILSLNIDGKTWEIGEEVKVEILGSGEISVGNDGKVRVKADASMLKLNSWKTSSVEVKMEMLPESFSVNSTKADLMSMSSVTGNGSKKIEDFELKFDFEKANLKIEKFSGKIEFKEKLKIIGNATNLEINGKKI